MRIENPSEEVILKKLIIVPSSIRMHKEPLEPIPALQRFNGIFIKMIRKYNKRLRDCDVLILSPIYGLIDANRKIGFKEPIRGSWHKLKVNDIDIEKLRETSLSTLKKKLIKRQYDEIYVNLGRDMLKIIEGFDKIVPQTIRITYSKGRGVGPKLRHMKDWIELQVQKG